ncbi:MFS transporter [Pseudomonas schmalbachii]|uniref:MFS transporter n=1 Tax=Pseudomonas schmalbachii TaxID=2816993 RepID=A0ABS3TJU6_9PSED|nr:MFS transporter [Pseudomonas schmalbachii]MBO3273939.1 MFS transporter [Pseudomonas schmalbachii]
MSSTPQQYGSTVLHDSPATAASVYRKAVWRLMPFLFLALLINGIDRINISFAKLRMAEDIALSDAAYGLGVGAFYLAYLLFEVPSNLYMQRVGARATLTRIMVLWGLITMATALVTTPGQLIAARFLLGIAEAGFFPGVILYLTYWFPSALRGRITASFMMAAVVAGMICGPLSGTIMAHLDGWIGLQDWQALFILTGAPAVVLGVFGWFWLTDRPDQAGWLSDAEKQAITTDIAAEQKSHGTSERLVDAFRDPRVYIAGLVYFSIYCGTNTVIYWLPTLIRGLGLDDIKLIGLVSALPFTAALAGMYLLGLSSDKRHERRWHVAGAMLVSAACFALLGFTQGQLVASLVVIGIAASAGLSALSLFWTIPPAFLTPTRAVAGIAIISSIGNFAGVVSQGAVGAIKSATGSLYLAFDMIAMVLVAGALLLLIAIPARILRSASH